MVEHVYDGLLANLGQGPPPRRRSVLTRKVRAWGTSGPAITQSARPDLLVQRNESPRRPRPRQVTAGIRCAFCPVCTENLI